MASTRHFGEGCCLPALGSENLKSLLDGLAQKLPTAALPSSVPPAVAEHALTTNSAAAFSSSGNARLDLFFKGEATGISPYGRYCMLPGEQLDTGDALETLLAQAWQEDALDTVKLIAHLRDVRDGKGDKKQFQTCVQWLAKHQTATLVKNLPEIVKVGYWKDLLDILQRMCERPEERQAKKRKRDSSDGRTLTPLPLNADDSKSLKDMRKKTFRKYLRKLKTEADKEEARALRSKQVLEKEATIKQIIKQQRQVKREGHKLAVQRLYAEDVTFRLVHLLVAQLFAQQLQKDQEALKEGRPSDVSLAAKWAPTPSRSHDEVTFIATSIAELLFPSQEHRAKGQSYAEYIGHIRGLYHKTLLTPLRKCLDITEVYMSAKAWGDVQYPRVPSICMKNNKTRFAEHDMERFQEYLIDVQAGKKKIASGALKPHELVLEAMQIACFGAYALSSHDESNASSDMEDGEVNDQEGGVDHQEVSANNQEGSVDDQEGSVDDQEGSVDDQEGSMNDQESSVDDQESSVDDQEGSVDNQEGSLNDQEGSVSSAEKRRLSEEAEMQASQQTMELQWKSYVSNLKASGSLSSALAVCDVSGSMAGEPMQVAIALGLLTAEVTAPPFNNLVCTFSSNPELHQIKGDSLVQKVQDLQSMEWGMSTDLNKTFDLILERAIVSNVAPEDMIQTLFIFSDMQFDEAVRSQTSSLGDSPQMSSPEGSPAHRPTNFHAAKAAFEEQGYKLPKVVFWNLNDESTIPVTSNEEGAALVSGFSGQLLKLFMGGASELERFNPFNVMKEAISAEKYMGWQIVD